MGAARQLAFVLGHDESFAREDFIAGQSNAAALALIEKWPDWPGRVAALVGPEGSGKSHLASIWAEAAGARVVSARLLTDTGPVAALSTGALVVEDLTPGKVDERGLFHVLNLAREERAFVLLTSRVSLSNFATGIRDLASRLRAIPAVALAAPDERLLRALIVKLAADRQLLFDDALVSFLVSRIERSFAGAREAVARLDAEAMRMKRPPNRALAAELWRVAAS